jgi:uncharacterized protein
MNAMVPPLPEVIERRQPDIVALARRFRVETLMIFGSAATGEFDPSRSDIDLVVRFRDMPPTDHADCYFGLLHALEDLLGTRVDLLEEEAISNPYLQRSIDQSKRTLYAA